MTPYTLSARAAGVIQNYLHLPFPQLDVPCPYYNNRRAQVRAALRAVAGKGSVDDIIEEVNIISLREKKPLKDMSPEAFTTFLVEHKIGIDCSGLAYYILDAESIGRNYGPIRYRLQFPYAKSIWRKLLTKFRPTENAGVTTFAHENNSREIDMSAAMPGDYIVILYTGSDKTYNHIAVIHQVDYQDGVAVRIHYTHSFQWPSDGLYRHGVRQGQIEITDRQRPLFEQQWTEQGKNGSENYTQEKAREAMYVSIRRLKWF